MNKPTPLDCLLSLLQSRYHSTRAEVLGVLGSLGDESLVSYPIQVLQNDRDSLIRCSAACALSEIGGPKAVDALILALKDKEVFYAAACALGSIGDKRSIRPLMKLIKNHSLYEKQRIRAAETLSHFKNLQVVEVLKQVMNDRAESELMRSFAANVIGNMQSADINS